MLIKIFWPALLLFIFSFNIRSQDYIVTEEMDTIFGKIDKIEANRARITSQADNKKVALNSDQINSVYIEGEHAHYRSKLLPGKKKQIWLLKEIISGRISIYARTLIVTTGSGMSDFQNYYLEKDNGELHKIPTDFLSSGESTRQNLKQLMVDDILVQEELDTLTMNAKNIGFIINKYNQSQSNSKE